MEEQETMTAVDIAGVALARELERLESGQLNGGDARNDCIDNIVKLSRVITEDDKRSTQMFVDQQKLEFEQEKLKFEQEKLERQQEMEERKLEAEINKQKAYNTLKSAEIGVGICTFIGSMIFTSMYFTKQAIFETTGTTRTAFGKSALKLAEPFQRKITRVVNDL